MCSLIGIGAPLIVIYLMVGFALSIAWAETTPERSDESSFTNYIRWILFWPHFLIKRSETGARPEFWQLAREHPDIAYQWMLNDPETWLVVEPGSDKEAALAALVQENGGDEERPIGLKKLIAEGAIATRAAEFYDSAPAPLPADFSFGRIEGMLLGLAVGDSLGVTSEGLAPEHRLGLFGEIRDYLAIPKTGLRVGIPSDDTQLAFWTLEQMLEDDGFVPENIARRFATGQIFGIGATVMAFRDAFEEKPHPWWECGQPSAGDGALMRIAPMVVPHLRMPSTALWAETALCSAITHNDTASISSCVAFVAMLWDLLGCTEPPEPTWWVDRFVEVAMDLETDTVYRPRAGDHQGFAGKLTDFVEQTVPEAHAQGLPVVEACESWYSGAYLLETVPSVLYILMRHGHDAEEAIVRAVNDTRDNDTIAAIVGAAVGALHGREALPDRWLEGHTGRTKADDDGRIFELLELARKRWWEDSA